MKRKRSTSYRNKDAVFFKKVGNWKKKIRSMNIFESKPRLRKQK